MTEGRPVGALDATEVLEAIFSVPADIRGVTSTHINHYECTARPAGTSTAARPRARQPKIRSAKP